MTHNGYSFKRPTLASNYIQLLTTIQNLNDYYGYCPNKKQLRMAVPHDVKDGWNLGRGFRRIVQKLTDGGFIHKNVNGGLYLTAKGVDLISTAANRTIASIERN